MGGARKAREVLFDQVLHTLDQLHCQITAMEKLEVLHLLPAAVALECLANEEEYGPNPPPSDCESDAACVDPDEFG